MKSLAFVSVSLASLVACASSASAGIVGTSAVLVTQANQKPGFTTYDVFVQFTDAADSISGTSGWNVVALTGSFFNANPAGSDDPFGVIDDSAGNTPIDPAIIAVPGHANWQYDTNISINDSHLSVAAAGTSITSSSIAGGITGPAASAGADLMIQIGQITVTAGGTFSGTATITTPDAFTSSVITVTNVIPAPGALALLGLAGLVGSRRRRMV